MSKQFRESAAPRLNPMSYPGAWVPHSVVITHDHLWRILDRNEEPLAYELTRPVRLGLSRVAVDHATAERTGGSLGIAPQLGRLLEAFYAAPMDARVPVIAIGSNASPAQLRHKFRDRPDSLLIPSVHAKVTGLRVGYAPFVAGYGSVPATVMRAPGSEVTLAVQFLDATQLANLDRSESPSYQRVWLSGDDGVQVQLETGEFLDGAYAYVAKDGYIVDQDHKPLVLRTPGAQLQGLTQPQVVADLLSDPVIAAVWGESAEQLHARAKQLPEQGLAALRAAHRVGQADSWNDHPDEMGTGSTRVYGNLLPRSPRIDELPDAFTHLPVRIVASTPNGVRRGGKSIVRISASLAEQLGKPSLLEVRSAQLMSEHGSAAPAALAGVIVRDTNSDVREDLIEADHVIRMACGVEVGETIVVQPAELSRDTVGDLIVGSPTYLTMRVTLADPASAERDIILMNKLALDIIGVAPGDYVVVEGAGVKGSHEENAQVQVVVLKAFEASEAVEENRHRVTGGTWGARFPAAIDTLGVRSEIPLAFLDYELRVRLGVHAQTLGTVRVRPARLHQFWAELREIVLILAVAFIGVVVVAPYPWLQALLILALLALTLGLVIYRLRRRFTHVLGRIEKRSRRRSG